MAHSRKLHPPTCDCGRKATVEVFGAFNAPYGPKCKTHGDRLVKQLQIAERTTDGVSK